MGFNGFGLRRKNKERVNKHRARCIPRRCCGTMRQRPKEMMLFSKTQYSVFTFQQGPLLSDTLHVTAHTPLLGEKQYEKENNDFLVFFYFLSELLWPNNTFLIWSSAEVTQNVTDWYSSWKETSSLIITINDDNILHEMYLYMSQYVCNKQIPKLECRKTHGWYLSLMSLHSKKSDKWQKDRCQMTFWSAWAKSESIPKHFSINDACFYTINPWCTVKLKHRHFRFVDVDAAVNLCFKCLFSQTVNKKQQQQWYSYHR